MRATPADLFTPYSHEEAPEGTDVELQRKDRDGKPLVVHVEPIEMFTLIEIMGTLPGYLPPAPGDKGQLKRGAHIAWERYKPRAPRLIELSCAPQFGEDGIPLEYLAEHEQFVLVSTILAVSGWFGGPALRVARFPGVDGSATAGIGRNGSLGVAAPPTGAGDVGVGAVGDVPGAGGDAVGALPSAAPDGSPGDAGAGA